jgi:pilin isopeptide linkage protein
VYKSVSKKRIVKGILAVLAIAAFGVAGNQANAATEEETGSSEASTTAAAGFYDDAASTCEGTVYTGSGSESSENDHLLSDILGDARYYGIVAHSWNMQEAETNAAVETITANFQSGNDLTNTNSVQPWVVGRIDGEKLRIKGTAAEVWAPASEESKISNETGSDLTFHPTSSSVISDYVDGLISQAQKVSDQYGQKSSVIDLSGYKLNGSTTVPLDLTSLGAGAFTINIDDVNQALINAGGDGLQIEKNEDQTVVLNVTGSGSVSLGRFAVTQHNDDGSTTTLRSGNTSTASAADLDKVASTIVWNIPNAQSVTIVGSTFGIVLAPRAAVAVRSTSSGWLVADSVANVSAEWHNIWQDLVKPVCSSFTARKTLTGGTLKAGQFSFDLKDAAGDVIDTATNDAQGNIAFDAVKFVSAGTYTFTMSEKVPADATTKNGRTVDADGIIYDTQPHTVTVTVNNDTDDGDLGVTSVIYDGKTKETVPTFANKEETLTPTEWTPTVSKALTGRDLSAGEFSFVVTDVNGKKVSTGTNTVNGTISFEPITENSAGTYTYAISEAAGSEGGVTYDSTVITANVKIEETDGKLAVAKVTYTENGKKLTSGETPTFNNTYTSTGTVSLKGDKKLTGRALRAGDDFRFQLTGTGIDTAKTVDMNDDGTFSFDDISLNKGAGTYTYEIREVGAGTTKDGVTYDSTPVEATVKVTDDAKGKLVASSPVYTKGGKTVDLAEFTNTYSPTPASASFNATKELNGKALKEDEFTFTLTGANERSAAVLASAANQKNADLHMSATNAADGSVDFGSVQFATPGVYEFRIAEKNTGETGVEYDTATYTASVNVSDAGNGRLVTSKVRYSTENGSAPEFVNTYSPAAVSVQLGARKTLDGAAPQDRRFSFELVDEAGNVVQTAENGEEGAVAFDKITYAKAGTHVYTMREVNDGQDAITYDDSSYKATVTVTSDGQGHLKTAVDYSTDDAAIPTFENTTIPPSELAVTGSAPQIVAAVTAVFLFLGTAFALARRHGGAVAALASGAGTGAGSAGKRQVRGRHIGRF